MVDNKRQFFRINYPPTSYPQLVLHGDFFDVTDVSEQGIRFLNSDPHAFQIGENVTGKIRFGERYDHDINAEIKRIFEDSTVLLLNNNIPLKLIMSEQRFLIKKFGKKIKHIE